MAPSEQTSPSGMLPTSSVGAMLRRWRQERHFSQLALSLEAEVSARHLSFIETGRATPSREMLLHLADHLQIPHRERNVLLVAAGYAPAYSDRSFDDPALAEVRNAVDLLLASLAPCPALAVDRRWTLLASNRMADCLLTGLAPELVQEPLNVLRASLHPRGLAPRIANLVQWRGYVLNRLRRDAELTGDPFLGALLDELQSYEPPDTTGVEEAPAIGEPDGSTDVPAVVPLHLHTDAGLLSFISTTTVFGSAVDVTVTELAVEAFLPADENTTRALERLDAATATG